MLNLEQVKLLENKVAKAIEYVERVTGENAALQAKLESYQKRIDELEVVVMRFKEDQGRIEDGILSALDRLNRFESAVEKSLKDKTADAKAAAEKTAAAAVPKPEKKIPEKTESAPPPLKAPPPKAAPVKAAAAPKAPIAAPKVPTAEQPAVTTSDTAGEMFFEIPEAETGEDIADPLDGENPNEELDIF